MDYKTLIDTDEQSTSLHDPSVSSCISGSPVVPLDSVYNMLHTLDRKSKLWLINRLTSDIQEEDNGEWSSADLSEVIRMSEQDVAAGRLHSNAEVMEMIKARIYAS